MTNTIDSKQLAENIAVLLDKKKARDVKILRVTEKTVIADYFVIAGGTSSTQVKALADEVEYQIGVNDGIKPTMLKDAAQAVGSCLTTKTFSFTFLTPKCANSTILKSFGRNAKRSRLTEAKIKFCLLKF